MSTLIGIDPGKEGAIAVTHSAGYYEVYDMPTTPVDLLALMDGLPPHATVVIEKAQTMPKMGVVGAFNYGMNYGMLIAHIAGEYPYHEVSPSVWKRKLGLTADKDKTRARAQALFPLASLKRKQDHNRAEALLLCEYAKVMGW